MRELSTQLLAFDIRNYQNLKQVMEAIRIVADQGVGTQISDLELCTTQVTWDRSGSFTFHPARSPRPPLTSAAAAKSTPERHRIHRGTTEGARRRRQGEARHTAVETDASGGAAGGRRSWCASPPVVDEGCRRHGCRPAEWTGGSPPGH